MMDSEDRKRIEETKNVGITYQEMKKAFIEEAGPLLEKEQVEQVLEKEEKKFWYADILGISTTLFVGKNVGRYTKGLLRRKQPFFFLYAFLGFMMEFSVLVFLYLLLFGIGKKLFHPDYLFAAKHEFLYAAVWIGSCLLFVRIKAERIGSFLSKCTALDGFFSSGGKEGGFYELWQGDHEMDRLSLRKKAEGLFVFPAIFFVFFGIACCLGIWKWDLSEKVTLDVLTAFLIYVAFAILSGIHNVIYGSFLVPYGSIGGTILMRKGKEETEAAVARYKMLCYERMIGYRGKTMEEFFQDAGLAEEMMKKIRGRMAVYRGGTFFGILIFLVLVFVCVVQMVLLKFQITVMLGVFTFLAVLGTLLFLLAFLSAHAVIKTLH